MRRVSRPGWLRIGSLIVKTRRDWQKIVAEGELVLHNIAALDVGELGHPSSSWAFNGSILVQSQTELWASGIYEANKDSDEDVVKTVLDGLETWLARTMS